MDSATDVANSGVEILIVEDSPTQAEHLKHFLEENGFMVSVASNGMRGLEEAKRRKPTLIISDVLMPVMDGYTFCKRIKSDETLKNTPVVLLTSLSSPQDVVKGLECGADNFIRKPHDEKYLLARIMYILANRELRKNERMQAGVLMGVAGQIHVITSERQQILDLLISTYEQAICINEELQGREQELAYSHQWLNGLYRIAKGLNRCTNEQEVVQEALERALELPDVRGGWVFLHEGMAGLRLAGARGLSLGLEGTGPLEGDCQCHHRLLSGEFQQVTNIVRCELMQKAQGDLRAAGCHVSIPLWVGSRKLGIMNLVGPGQGLFSPESMNNLNGVGNQIAIALERARLHEHLERLVQERTAALTAEIAVRKEAEAALRRSRDELEARVQERTAELAKANDALEGQYRQLQEANRLKSEFLANMSHELRTPLNAIIGFAELMHDGKVGPVSSDHREYLGDILTSSRHLLQLINDVLDLSKVESGKMEFRPVPVDMAKLIGEVRDILRTLAASRRMGIETETDSTLTDIVIDAGKLKQVLYNYLSNALKFTADEGRVTVRVVPEGTEAFRLEVEDTGIGIRPEDMGRLFVEFQQLDASIAKKYQGTGLGLALTKRIVEAQGGRVGVRSTPGRGSVFFAVLPRVARSAEEIALAPGLAQERTGGR